MALTSRLSFQGPPSSDPEDFLASSLGVIFPDDVMCQHGDAAHALLYTSPHLPRPLRLALADPDDERERALFSHYLWNSSLLLAELIEAGTLKLDQPLSTGGGGQQGKANGDSDHGCDFDIENLACLELGAGCALPSLMAALLGASRVLVTDYPAPVILSNLRSNIAANTQQPACTPVAPIAVEGHAWGALDTPLAAAHRGGFDRVFVCDCLWMPWQHANLLASIAWFLRDGENGGRAWVVGGFHTGREKMRGFFAEAALRDAGLEIERIWERDCDGVEREWAWDRGVEEVSERKRWQVIGVLRKVAGSKG
ncbi:hypothetical protein F5B20DRAFT_544288 [Whalleya microplaca]|nr:hypothetical protein F5B20DRAFT_544288 [Whalleya microplaca]